MLYLVVPSGQKSIQKVQPFSTQRIGVPILTEIMLMIHLLAVDWEGNNQPVMAGGILDSRMGKTTIP
jgi:hypothetical protein